MCGPYYGFQFFGTSIFYLLKGDYRVVGSRLKVESLHGSVEGALQGLRLGVQC